MNGENIKNYMKWAGSNDFPAPFSGRDVYNNNNNSMYSQGQSAWGSTNRVSYSIVNFLLKRYSLDKEANDIALGTTVSDFIAERYYTTANGTSKYQIAIYNENSGDITAFIVDEDTNKIELYPDDGSHSGLILLFALWELLYQDEEFFREYNSFVKAMDKNDLDTAWNSISVISDNVYRRLKGDVFLLSDINSSVSNELEIQENISKGTYLPTDVVIGTFKFLQMPENTETVSSIPLSDFVGKYPINKDREYTQEEILLMKQDKLEDFYIVGEDDIEICEDIIHTSNTMKPFRTFTLVGPPGTGKSHKVKAIANAVVLPNKIFTCNPSTEIFDLTGQVMPPSMDDMERDAWDLASKVEELGGLNFKNISKIYKLPTVEDILICPEEVYSDITGKEKTDLGKTPTVNDAMKAWTVYMTEQFNSAFRKMKVAMKTGTNFQYTETDFIKAIKNGWCVEVQEPNVILNEGVLVGLNSILNEGVITLQNGKNIVRHPDSLVFFTTNHNLNGLRDMNQSFLDRSSEIFYVEKPPINVVADRVISISGNTDRKMVIEMCKLAEEIENAMDKESIDDGICGMRSIINWAIKATYTNPYKAAIKTLINKTSLDDKNRKKLQKKLDESYFYQFKGL